MAVGAGLDGYGPQEQERSKRRDGSGDRWCSVKAELGEQR